jgi:hypothetical protein
VRTEKCNSADRNTSRGTCILVPAESTTQDPRHCKGKTKTSQRRGFTRRSTPAWHVEPIRTFLTSIQTARIICPVAPRFPLARENPSIEYDQTGAPSIATWRTVSPLRTDTEDLTTIAFVKLPMTTSAMATTKALRHLVGKVICCALVTG